MESLYLWSYNFLGVGGIKWKVVGQGGGWSNWKKTLRGGYGYFLEQHIVGQIHV